MNEIAGSIDFPIFSAVNLPPDNYKYKKGAAFLINKPKGWTSFDVVKYIRKSIDVKKVGHAGTLDPMATGLLILCSGKATKSIQVFQNLNKRYRAVIRLGASTPSYDAETEIDQEAPYSHITEEMIKKVIRNRFEGEIEQVPPMYSALKYKGKPLYKLARKGKKVKRESRKVSIYQNELLEFDSPEVSLLISCSKGTYIRSIAHELGLALQSRAYLKDLEREAIGRFENKDALTLNHLRNIKFD